MTGQVTVIFCKNRKRRIRKIFPKGKQHELLNWKTGDSEHTLLGNCNSCNPTRGTMGARVWGHACAGIIIAIWCHCKWQSFKICANFFCKIHTEVSSISVRLAFCVCEWSASKVGAYLWVLWLRKKVVLIFKALFMPCVQNKENNKNWLWNVWNSTNLFLNMYQGPHSPGNILQDGTQPLSAVGEVDPAFRSLTRRRRSSLWSLPANSRNITCGCKGWGHIPEHVSTLSQCNAKRELENRDN